MKPGIWNMYKDAVKKDFPNREPNMCNLLDSAYAAAKMLSHVKGGWYPNNTEVNKNKPCTESVTGLYRRVDLNAKYSASEFLDVNKLSESCNWTLEDIVTATNHYNGSCANPVAGYTSYQQSVCSAYDDTLKVGLESVCSNK
jgi:hypothetical protein